MSFLKIHIWWIFKFVSYISLFAELSQRKPFIDYLLPNILIQQFFLNYLVLFFSVFVLILISKQGFECMEGIHCFVIYFFYRSYWLLNFHRINFIFSDFYRQITVKHLGRRTFFHTNNIIGYRLLTLHIYSWRVCPNIW